MKNKLNWFDRLMMAVTFAEAGVDVPHVKGEAGKERGQQEYINVDPQEINPAARPYLKTVRQQ